MSGAMRGDRRWPAFIVGIALCFGYAACARKNAEGPTETSDGLQIFKHRISAFGGELVGSNHGEFGGELAFRSQDGKITPLMEANVVALHATPSGFVAVTGLAHLTHNEGEVLSVTRTRDDRLTVDQVAALPFAPLASRLRTDGSIEMKLFSGDLSKDRGLPLHVCALLQTDRTVHDIDCPEDWREPLSWDAYESMSLTDVEAGRKDR